jgi:hypothetical protein
MKPAHLLLLLSLCFVRIANAQPESWYAERIASALHGTTEYPVENGRVDVVTNDYAIEVKRADDWKHAIGQSLWYALQTNKKPGIVLIVLDENDWKMGIRLNSTLQHAGLADKVKVWYYPADFQDGNATTLKQEFQQAKKSDPRATNYWLSSNSGVRHNSRCQWYETSKGKYCTVSEGRACGKCGG